MERKPDKLLHLILIYVIISGFSYWLPTTRGLFDGSTYSWSGWLGIGGTGIGGQYWLLLIFTTIMIALIYCGWRGMHKPFRWLLLTWFLILIIESGAWFITSDTVYIKGDTLGIDISIANILFPLDLLFLVLSCVWIIRNLRSDYTPSPYKWKRINRNLLILFFCLLPIQFIILRFFDNYEITDQLGVFLTMFQWILLNLSFYPWKSRS